MSIRIVTLAPHLNLTEGWGTVPANVLPLLSHEHEVVALVGEEVSNPDQYGFEVRHVIPSPLDMYHPVQVLWTSHKIRKEIRDADIVHSFIAYPYLPAAALASIGQNTRLTTHALGTYAVRPLTSWSTRALLSFGYRRADAVLCISEYTEQRILAEINISGTHVIPLGVNLNEFGKGEPTDNGYILSVAAIKRRKGQDTLLEAFSHVSREFPDIDLLFVGPIHDSDFKRRLDRIIEERGLENRVKFLGEVSDDRLKELYRNCTLFALTPRVVDDNFEGSGLVYLEAAAYSKPAVGTRSGGVPTSINHGETGYLAPEGDSREVADALRALLSDKVQLRQFGQNARERVESMTWEWYVDEMCNVILPD